MATGGPAVLAGAATLLDGLMMGADVVMNGPAAADGSTAVQGAEPAVETETNLVSPGWMLLDLAEAFVPTSLLVTMFDPAELVCTAVVEDGLVVTGRSAAAECLRLMLETEIRLVPPG